MRTVVATWCAAFPRTAAWLTAYDLALIGWGEGGIAGGRRRADGAPRELALPPRGRRPRWRRRASGTGFELAALQVADDAALRAFAAGTEPMVENHPVLEFRAPKSFLAGYSVEALRWAGRSEFVSQLPAPAQARASEVRSALTRFLERLPQGLSEAARLYGEELLAPR